MDSKNIDNTDSNNAALMKRINIEGEKEFLKKLYFILEFSSLHSWHYVEHVKKAFDLLAQGYELDPYQIHRLENEFDIIKAFSEEESVSEINEK